ncbi:MAG: hypothetical protein Q8K18_19455 [Burkholderiales bacterium]|nr:hypothetical protein [Burkholderiales bacterium]
MAAPADDIKNLLDQGRPADAYTLGREHPDELGKPAFDFYFGIAAVGSGHAGEGVLALERYVVNVPEDINGRLELARGYFVLGEDARAREEFETALAAKPPADVQANVQRFLDAIRARESQYRPSATYVLEAGYGYDSNASGGPGSTSLILPNGVGVSISDRFSRSLDNFQHLLASASGSRPISPGVSLFGIASIDTRMYDTESRFDQYSLSASGGLSLLREKNFYRGTVSFNRLYLENDRYRDVASVSGEWQHQLDELQAVNAFVQVSDLDYAAANSLRNSNFYTLGGGYRRAFIHPWQPLVRANLYLGKEDVRSGARSDLARDVYGVRLAASFSPVAKWGISLGVTYQKSDYAGGDPLPAGFTPLPPRKDDYWASDISASYALTRQLSVRGELMLSKNDSNNPLYEYRRNVASMKLRYEFK